jgi:DNA processing protein
MLQTALKQQLTYTLERVHIELLNRHLISIFGSRRLTPYGNQMAERGARVLADRGLVVVSGLARGVDSSAHKGALSSAAGATIGVLGCGIGLIYPNENKKIFAEMETRGAITSEFTMGTFPGPQNFPIRNRVIAGMFGPGRDNLVQSFYTRRISSCG